MYSCTSTWTRQIRKNSTDSHVCERTKRYLLSHFLTEQQEQRHIKAKLCSHCQMVYMMRIHLQPFWEWLQSYRILIRLLQLSNNGFQLEKIFDECWFLITLIIWNFLILKTHKCTTSDYIFQKCITDLFWLLQDLLI